MTDFPIGQDKLLYSTAEVFTYAVMDKKPTLVLWVHPDESGEICFTGSHQGKLQTCDGCRDVQFNVTENGTILKFTQGPGLSVTFVGDTRVIMVDRSGAYAMFAPTLTNDPLAPVNQTGKFLSLEHSYPNLTNSKSPGTWSFSRPRSTNQLRCDRDHRRHG